MEAHWRSIIESIGEDPSGPDCWIRPKERQKPSSF